MALQQREIKMPKVLRRSEASLTKRMHKILGECLWSCLERDLPPYAKVYLDDAKSGDKAAAFSLCLAAPNEWRGWIAVAAYRIGVPNPGYQTIIRAVWNHNHAQLLAAVQNYPMASARDPDEVRQ
jgi:hypothetical protein